ncbi:MAG: bifunctional ADP-dependent NAD(P)H-hydrate dehydratase/NAD(P)H-hydrate epimerase [Alphaproteobacteria bacterium PA2]|nr:MAG: bifunctional ADP-dependent NAD(P)H-hydrate dehydratase/NAD(P)H-hydrate epimerase [Alphaproteobacteria bacterium PA2]
MAAADAAAVSAGQSIDGLMARAGLAVADEICERFRARPTAVLCGPGNNGGDGYVVARILGDRGWPVWVEALSSPSTDAAIHAASLWKGPVHALGQTDHVPELTVDALFGAGLGRPLEGVAARMARASEARTSPVVAIDTPSGVFGDTGKPLGDAAFWADLTITFHARKIAHVLTPGMARCGELVVADIGIPPSTSALVENGPDLWLADFPWPGAGSHKHERGRMVVVSGEPWNTGAARLASRAGLRIGAGVVTMASPPESLSINAAHLEAVMLRPFETETDLEQICANVDAVVIGPAAGVSESTLLNTLALARTGAALVIDADAISVFRDDPEELFSALDVDDVLTPHPGEFERLFPGLLAASPERITAARRASARADAVVLLKGFDTVIAHPDGRAAVSTNGSPWLATAGSGDVLAGFIAGLIAQGMDSFEAACAAVWIHAEAGEAFGPGLTAEDLPGLAPSILRKLYAAR